MTPEEDRKLNEAFFVKLEEDSEAGRKAADSVCDFTRAKMGLPPLKREPPVEEKP